MARLIPTDFLKNAKDNQRQHVRDMSRDIIIITGNEFTEDCPNCYYDSVAGTSSASYTGMSGTITIFSGTAYEQTFEAKNFRRICPVCNGVGYFTIPEQKIILAHIYWTTNQRFETYPESPAGSEGQNTVKLKANSDYYSDFVDAAYFIVDGIEVKAASTPIIRSIGQKDGIVEIWCRTMNSAEKDIRT